MIICITGYRPGKLPTEYGYDIHNKAWAALKRAFTDVSLFLWAQYGHRLTIYTGMALGVDQAFAEAAFDIRKQIPNVKVIAAIPCYNHEVKWPVASRELYHDILKQCDHSVYVTKTTFTSECMDLRNQFMVDHSDVVIAVYDGKSGGTKNCIKYAQKKGKKIISINPSTLQICVCGDPWRLI